MRSNVATIPQHRLQRFHRWAMLWLKWFAAFVDAASARAPLSPEVNAIGHSWLDAIERLVINIIFLRALPALRPFIAAKHAQRRRNDSQIRRAIIGGYLRRALRAKHLRQRIARLSQNMDALVARLIKRLLRGLTRRRPICPHATPHPVLRALASISDERVADTS